MLDDLVELATTVVHPNHTPDIAPHISGASSSRANAKMPPRRRQSKSQSISSAVDVNGMLPPATPVSGTVKTTRKPRSKSTTSQPGSPRPLISGTTRKAATRDLAKYAGAVTLSIVVQAGLQTVASTFLGTGELAAISKQPESWLEIGSLLGWRVLLLSLYWFGGFDGELIHNIIILALLIRPLQPTMSPPSRFSHKHRPTSSSPSSTPSLL